MSGRSTLTATCAAVGGDGAMDLGDRGGADRLRVDVRENASSGLLETLSIASLICVERRGRQAVLEHEQVARRFLADQIGPGRERLAELDRGRADLLEGLGIGRTRGTRAPNRAIRASRRTGGGVFGSRSMPRSAPWRASTRPHFSSRQIWVIGGQVP